MPPPGLVPGRVARAVPYLYSESEIVALMAAAAQQVGQVGHVGAEVVAAGAAEPERTGPTAGFDVGWFGADAERDGDLADGVAGVFGVQ